MAVARVMTKPTEPTTSTSTGTGTNTTKATATATATTATSSGRTARKTRTARGGGATSRAGARTGPGSTTACAPGCAPPAKKPLPAGQPREWYVTHNRRLKAMRLAIALLDAGVHHPNTADNRRIRRMADRIGVHPPSDTTCRMVRALIRYGR